MPPSLQEEDTGTALARCAPTGIDCYFDNVGGDASVAAVKRLNHGARVAVCGAIHLYNATSVPAYLASKV